jgi:hypothetical protein
VKQKRPHQKDISTADSTDVLGTGFSDRRDQFFRDSTLTMRARYHSQRPIFLPAGVEVKAKRKHLIQHSGGRLNMQNVGLVKENAAHGKAFCAKYRLDQTTDEKRAGKLAYFRAFFQQIANRENTHFLPETRVFVHSADGG